MGDEKIRCPFCGEEILAIAKKCKHCGEFLDGKAKSNDTTATAIEQTVIKRGISDSYEADSRSRKGGKMGCLISLIISFIIAPFTCMNAESAGDGFIFFIAIFLLGAVIGVISWFIQWFHQT